MKLEGGLVCLALGLGFPTPGRGGTEEGMDDITKKRIVYAVPGMDRVTVRRDLVYKTVEGAALHMDVYRPPDAARESRLPVVVLVHGGPIDPRMTPKDWGVFRSYGELLAASGLAAVTFNHRLYAPARVRDAAADVADLLTHLRREGEALGLDTGRIAVWAFSGGGFLLSGVVRDAPAEIRALVAYYAILDLQVPPPGADNSLSAETRRELSPVAQVEAGAPVKPPILIARAGRDNPWLNASIDRFAQAALARNVSLDLLTHPNGQHGFDILDDDARSREILRATVSFLKERLN